MEKKTDLRIERTYRLLHNAFTELLEEKKFDEFTVNELCERAMIRRTTFYKHFADKYEYVTFYFKEICEDFKSQLSPDLWEGELNPYILQMCRQLFRFIQEHQKLVGNFVNSSYFHVLIALIIELLQEDTLRFLRHNRLYAHMTRLQMEGLAYFYAGGILNTMYSWMRQGNSLKEQQFVEMISGIIKSMEATV